MLLEDLPTVLERIVRAAYSHTRADEGTVFLLDYRRDELYVSAAHGIDDPSFKKTRIKVGEMGEPVCIALDSSGPRVHRGIRYARGRQSTALLSIPIVSGKTNLGVLCACRRQQGAFPAPIERALLINLANLAALAIENHRQSEEARHNSEAFAAAVEWGKDPEPLLQKVVDSARDVAGAQVVVLYEYDEATDDVRIPPKISGRLRQREVLFEKGRIAGHRDSVVFKMLDQRDPVYATEAFRDWFDRGFYQSQAKVENSFVGREQIESSAAVPLWIQGIPVGVLFINYRSPQVFTSGLKRRIELFAGQAAIAIRNSRRSERHTRQLELLQDVGNTLNACTATDIPAFAGVVHDQAKRLMHAKNFILCLYDAPTKSCRPVYMKDDNDRAEQFDERDWNSGLCAAVCKAGVPLLRNDATLRLTVPRPIGTPAVSWLGAPMRARGEVIGAIAVQSYLPDLVYNREHMSLLSTLAAQAATAIDHYLALSDAIAELNLSAGLSASAVALVLARGTAHNILKTILKQAVVALRADGGVIFRLDLAANEFVPTAVYATAAFHWPASRRLRWGEGITGRAAEQKTTLTQDDYREMQGQPASPSDSAPRGNPDARVAATLMDDEQRLLGVLTLMAEKRRPFTRADRENVNRFARLAEVALLRSWEERQHEWPDGLMA